jgi:hypothetical protein
MMFRQVKASLVALLEDNSGGQFRVFGSQRQGQSAAEFVGAGRAVRVYYSGGDFPKSAGSLRGPVDHSLQFTLELLVVEPSEVDLSVLESPTATPAQRVTALAGGRLAADRADDAFDEFAELLFQIIMDARNQDLGLADYTVGSRWIRSVNKRAVEPIGEYVMLAGEMNLIGSVEETVSGVVPVAGEIISGDITIKDDPALNTGAESSVEV